MTTFQLTLDAIEPPRIRTSKPAATQRIAVASEARAGSSKLPITQAEAYFVSSSFYNSRRCSTPLDLPVDVTNDATAWTASLRAVRPLPPIPKMVPAALPTTHQVSSSPPQLLRPLPSPPSSCSYSDSSTSSPETSRCSTPTTSSEDSHHPLSRSERFLPTLTPLPSNDPSLKSSPEWVDVSSICPPTPETAKRKRVEKLRRHLGEHIPYDAVCDHVRPRSANSKAHVLAKVQKSEIRTYVKAAIAAEKILELPCHGDDDMDDSVGSSSEDGGDDLAIQGDNQEDYTWVLENGTAFRAVDGCKSSKWVYEKGGKRWEEPSYKRVIQALRAL